LVLKKGILKCVKLEGEKNIFRLDITCFLEGSEKKALEFSVRGLLHVIKNER